MYQKVERNIGGKNYILETGKMAKQATAAVLMTCENNVVFSALVFDRPRPGLGDEVLPLTVEYREKTSAAGKFPGGFIKREGRPTNKEILTMRLIDRPIRPLFAHKFKNELQITALVQSADKDYDPDILAMNSAAACLALSGLKEYSGPIASVRVGMVGNDFILNPSYAEITAGKLDLIASGTMDAIVMVEGSAKEQPEEVILESISFAHKHIKEFIGMQIELRDKFKPAPLELEYPENHDELYNEIKAKNLKQLKECLFVKGKKEREKSVDKLRKSVIESYCKREKDPLEESTVNYVYNNLESDTVREFLLEGKRLDGRSETDIRQITIETGLLPSTHGSALFTRGETQALVIATLGTSMDEQRIDGLGEEYSKKFMLHYNFPPFCVGEAKPSRGPGRREIGHGALAERAIEAVMPDNGAFPYTIRIVSDILESNGSSSMATVCGGILCLMDAGVPIKSPVAGIAMGLVMDKDNYRVLSDIIGAEDANGDMDFKVAGTKNGITAFQLDVKLATGIPQNVMKKAIEQAKKGRMEILSRMLEAMPSVRADISAYAPRLTKIKINPEKIGAVIGTGGKVIKKIEETTTAKLEIEDTGEIIISGKNLEVVEKAKEIVLAIVQGPQIGKIYPGKVTGIKEFGAFVELQPLGKEGLLHISEMADAYVKNVDDVLKMGEDVKVMVIGVDEYSGKIRLSRKHLNEEPPQNK